jgi:hypothetical protein
MSQRLGMLRPPDTFGKPLLFLLGMHGVLAQPLVELAQLEFLAPWLPPQGVIVIAGFVAHQKHGFRFLFALSHDFLLRPKRLKPSVENARLYRFLGVFRKGHGL